MSPMFSPITSLLPFLGGSDLGANESCGEDPAGEGFSHLDKVASMEAKHFLPPEAWFLPSRQKDQKFISERAGSRVRSCLHHHHHHHHLIVVLGLSSPRALWYWNTSFTLWDLYILQAYTVKGCVNSIPIFNCSVKNICTGYFVPLDGLSYLLREVSEVLQWLSYFMC